MDASLKRIEPEGNTSFTHFAVPLSALTAKLLSSTNVTRPFMGVPGATSAAVALPYIVPPGKSDELF
jgi:hypothetical protein